MGINILPEVAPFLIAVALFALGTLGYLLLVVLTRRGVLGGEEASARNQGGE